ncbi:MAG: heavy metal translocating P-type ATPase [Vulcanimicrobiota bacterium]
MIDGKRLEIMEKIKIELPLILPCALESEDRCSEKLIELLQSRRGVLEIHLDPHNNSLYLCVHYDPAFFSPESIQEVIEKTGAHVKNRFRHIILRLGEMDCTVCAEVIEHSLKRLKGVMDASVNYAMELVRIDYDAEIVSQRQIEERITHLGYQVLREGVSLSWYRRHRELISSVICGFFLIIAAVSAYFHFNPLLTYGLFILSYFFGGYFATVDTVKTLKKGRFDIEFLMVLAAIGAAVLGKWHEGALLLFLFSLGHSLEHYAMDKARESIRALTKLAPKTAQIIRDGNESTVDISELQRGDIILIKPGERIAADGTVMEGRSSVDESSITGESAAVLKESGHSVFAGTLNCEGVLSVEVTKLQSESTLARILELIQEAQAQKAPSQRAGENFERYFVPFILAAVVLSILIPVVLGSDFITPFYRSLAVLVAASPCALAIATPSAILAGIARAARDGVLIKGGIHLENLGKLKAVAFDKTGTITEGKPHLAKIIPCEGSSEEELLTVAASVEKQSRHPLAKAIIEAAEKRDYCLLSAEKTESLTGRGIVSYIGNECVEIGKKDHFVQNGSGLPPFLEDSVRKAEEEGYTTMIVKKGAQYLGALALQDKVRSGAGKAIEKLKKLGIKSTLMISGDSQAVTAPIAESLGIDEYRAGLMPEDKVKAIDEYLSRFNKVAMVGDGVNDAPAMAHSTVGIAMGSAGSDAALETADVALMADNLLKIPFVVALGRRVSTVILQNLVISFGVMILLVLSVITDHTGVTGAVVIHEGSTLLVVLNALTILRYPSEV